jgi:hypothetical protein
VNFQYKYPYGVWTAASRYKVDYDTTRVTLSGNYTYPLSFVATTKPYIVRAKVTISASNTSGTSILNRSWYLYRYTTSWATVATFTMPADGVYVWEGTIGATVGKFAAVPTATMSSGTEWTLGLSVDEMIVQESVTTADLGSGEYFAAFPNQSGVTQRPTKVYANIGGTLTAAKKIYANIGGALTELPPVYSGTYTSTIPDSMRLFEFTPTVSGTYRFEIYRKSGDHEARLYDSSFNKLDDGYFYNGSFALTGGSLYYIMLTHYVTNTDAADSVLIINKI